MLKVPYWSHCIQNALAAETMQESLVFLFLEVDGLGEDQFIYVKTRENMFFHNMGPLKPGAYFSIYQNLISKSWTCYLKYIGRLYD